MLPLDQIKLESEFLSKFSSENAERQFYSLVEPAQAPKPEIIGWSDQLSHDLGISNPTDSNKSIYAELMTGKKLFQGSVTYASRYGGHQFGHWAGQLGDGRAILLGEILHDNKSYEVQLKGSGVTPYSRRGDGKAVLRSSIREFLCSEAMNGLKIPTTRALSLALTGESVLRDILYNGNVRPEPGAIVCRISPSFIRFGHFEILTITGQHKELKTLTDYVIEKFYSELKENNKNEVDLYADFLKSVVIKTAQMVSEWMSVGFVHGVMNTDNMSILGLTIDYGPYGWLDGFDYSFTPNTTDNAERRYRYSQQPAIALWNLNCLAHALFPLIQDREKVTQSLQYFQKAYEDHFINRMSEKLGVKISEKAESLELVTQLFDLMDESSCDFTLFFRSLSESDFSVDNYWPRINRLFYNEVSEEVNSKWHHWFSQYFKLVLTSPFERKNMKNVNPAAVFRNYLAQMCIEEAENKDYTKISEFLKCLETPFADLPKDHTMTQLRPDWAKQKIGCSQLSCSS